MTGATFIFMYFCEIGRFLAEEFSWKGVAGEMRADVDCYSVASELEESWDWLVK